MENRNEIAMKGDNELAVGRNMDQGQGFVCYLFLEIACYRLKDSNVQPDLVFATSVLTI